MNALTLASAVATMTSLTLVDFINEHREEVAKAARASFPSKGYAKLDHADLLKKVPEVLGSCAGNFSATYQAPGPNGGSRSLPCYRFPKREACLMAMSYSYELQARVYDYMTNLEAKASQQPVALPDFTNPAISARAWADQFEGRQAAEQKLALAAPKVAFVDKYVDSTGLKGFREVAKLLKANEARLREFLEGNEIMYRLAGKLTAYQQHIKAGRFWCKTGTNQFNGHSFIETKFTSKGVEWVAGLWVVHQLRGEGGA